MPKDPLSEVNRAVADMAFDMSVCSPMLFRVPADRSVGPRRQVLVCMETAEEVPNPPIPPRRPTRLDMSVLHSQVQSCARMFDAARTYLALIAR